MGFQHVGHLVDLALKSSVPGKLIHHTDGGELLLHVLDLCTHLHLLFNILLQHP